jgi:hypothetical protein
MEKSTVLASEKNYLNKQYSALEKNNSETLYLQSFAYIIVRQEEGFAALWEALERPVADRTC